jgi:hypothetical protein
MWKATPAWNDSFSEAEIRKESCRRLCWSAMALAAGHVNYAAVSGASRSTGLDLFVSDPANVAFSTFFQDLFLNLTLSSTRFSFLENPLLGHRH